MKKRIRLFCPYCGSKIIKHNEDDFVRDYCSSCGIFFYENPLPVVSTIVVSNREILLVKRGKRPYKGMWCLPTGFAESGESIEEAALRELEEEAGIKGRIARLIDVDSRRNYYYGDLLFLTFESEYVSGSLAFGGDTIDAKYFPIKRIPRLAFSSNLRAVNVYLNSKSEEWAIADSFAKTLEVRKIPAVQSTLLSDHLIRIIEHHSNEIIERWMADVSTNQSTAGYRHINQSWLIKGVRRILSQFGKWLSGYYNDMDIKDFYMKLGKGSKSEGLLLSEVLSSWRLLHKHTWEYALASGILTKTIDIYASLELDRRIISFFDRAAIYTAKGYENHL